MNPYVPAEWRQGEHLQALYREFCVKTTGQHSPALQRLINWLRSDPMQGKLALLCTVPHKEWQLVRMNGRGLPMSRLEETYHDIDDAERAIFRHRVRARLGYAPGSRRAQRLPRPGPSRFVQKDRHAPHHCLRRSSQRLPGPDGATDGPL